MAIPNHQSDYYRSEVGLKDILGDFFIKESKPKQPKSKELIDSFHQYCYDNPNLRFWQALLNWSGLSFIYSSKEPLYSYNDVHDVVEDTYYWEEKDK